jgi:flagellar motility protein MotE (MotC chaperone)
MQPIPAGTTRIRRRLAVAVAALIAVLLGSVGPGSRGVAAGTEAPAPPSTTSTTGNFEREGEPEAEPEPERRQRTLEEQRIVGATIALYERKADLATLERDVADVTDRLGVAETALATTASALTAARAELADVRSRLRERAVVVYQRHSDKLGMVLSVDRVVHLSVGTKYAESVATVDNGAIARLQGLVVHLEQRRIHQEGIRDELVGQKARLDRSRAELQAEVDRRQAEVDALGGVPIMGQSVLTAPQIAAWFRSTGQRARLMLDTPIEALAELYVSEGDTENVRGDLAFAQAVLETGSFGHATDNNFAGIGACDSCTSQYLFPSPRDGVRAQIQLLRNYADPFSRASMLRNPLDATLHGTDPLRAAQTFDTFPFKGRAPVWNVMGAGNWATDPLYAGKVLDIYARMLAHR